VAVDEWFRSSDWNSTIEAKFNERLGRSRDKPQYLRIQACHLAERHPEAALSLLDRYFLTGDKSHRASAFQDQATAYVALGRVEDAIQALRNALAHEREFTGVKTGAWSDFAMLVASRGLKTHFQEALGVLAENQSQSLLIFPLAKFKWHAAHALIREAHGEFGVAREHAIRALEAANAKNSGFRYHPNVGLVGPEFRVLRHQLFELSRERGTSHFKQ